MFPYDNRIESHITMRPIVVGPDVGVQQNKHRRTICLLGPVSRTGTLSHSLSLSFSVGFTVSRLSNSPAYNLLTHPNARTNTIMHTHTNAHTSHKHAGRRSPELHSMVSTQNASPNAFCRIGACTKQTERVRENALSHQCQSEIRMRRMRQSMRASFFCWLAAERAFVLAV